MDFHSLKGGVDLDTPLFPENTRRIIITPAPAAKNTFFYIHEAGEMSADRNTSIHNSRIQAYMLAAITGGHGKLTLENDSFILSKGDCFLIDCRSTALFQNAGSEKWEIMWIYFSGSTSEQYYDYFLSQSRNVFRPHNFDKVVSAISKIIEINEKKSSCADILTSKYIVDLLTIALTSNSSDSQHDSALGQKLSAVHDYIDEFFCDELSLEMLSSRFYISKFHLTREYKRIYGMTIFQHIITARINYGKKLLRFTDKSVEEIAHMCGFNDQSYFARQFKKSENLTCLSYRKMWRE